jgi:hypothetical protein
MKQALYQPTHDGNPFYKLAFDADFSAPGDDKALKEEFETQIAKLAALIKSTLEPVESLTQTAEVFHYGALAAVLLQHKAQLRSVEILAAAPPEHNVESMILAQFGVAKNEDDDDLLEDLHYDRRSQGQDLAKLMGKPFKYSGSLMRSLAMVATMSVCACRGNDMANAYSVLRGFDPIAELLHADRSQRFPVIGSANWSERRFSTMSMSSSLYDDEPVKVERSKRSDFCRVFADQLEKLLALESADAIDRARTEELRDFFFDTLVRFFFNLRSNNFPRVLSLVSVVAANAENGSVSEETLQDIAPTECTALLSNEAILTKDSVDMSMTWYRVNGGMRNFAMLVERFSLVSGLKLELLCEVVGAKL